MSNQINGRMEFKLNISGVAGSDLSADCAKLKIDQFLLAGGRFFSGPKLQDDSS